MKISRIRLANFRSHVNSDIKDLGKLVIVLGANGSGKSGLVDAISYGVTGVCRGTDEAGRGWESLVSPGPAGKPVTGVVTLETDLGLVNRMVGQGPKSAAQEKVTATLRLDRSALKCALRSQFFLDMDAKEQEALLRALVASEVTAAQVAAAYPAAQSGNSALLLTMDGVLAAYKTAYDQRTALKRVTFPQAEEPADVIYHGASVRAASDDELQGWLGEVRAAVAAVQANAQLRRQASALDGEIASHNRELDLLRKEIAPYPPLPDLQQKAVLLEKKVGEEETQRRERFEACRAAQQRNIDARNAIARLQKRLQDLSRMESERKKCDACGQWMSKQMAKVAQDEIVEQIREQERLAEKALESAKSLDEGHLLPVASADELAKVRKAIEAIGAIRARAKGIKERLALAQQKRDQLQFPEDVESDAPAVLPQLEMHWSYRQTKARNEVAEQRHREELEALEEAVKALGPGGPVRALHMGKGMPELLAEIANVATALGLGSVDISTAPKWAVSVSGRPAELLSASERFRASLAFAVVIARRTGVNMVCLDGADILDEDNRGVLLELIEKLGLEQVIVTATGCDENVRVEGWTTLHLRKDVDGVTRLLQHQEA